MNTLPSSTAEAAIGLTSDEARRRLGANGPNAVQDVAEHPINRALKKLWAPVPWMLEAAIVLQLVLGEYVEASAIGLLLVVNAGLGFWQEARAQTTLDALKARLASTASVRRDGVWKTLAATELVQGDIVKLSLGAVVAADVRLIESGGVLIDQSMLTDSLEQLRRLYRVAGLSPTLSCCAQNHRMSRSSARCRRTSCGPKIRTYHSPPSCRTARAPIRSVRVPCIGSSAWSVKHASSARASNSFRCSTSDAPRRAIQVAIRRLFRLLSASSRTELGIAPSIRRVAE